MPPETLRGQYLQQYFIRGGEESFTYMELWFQGKLKEKVLQSFNLWHFPPFHQRTARPLRGWMSLLLWSSSSLRFNGMMACWNGISHFEATTERVLTHGRRLHLKTLTQKTPAWNNPIVKSVKRTECYIKKKYGLPCVTWLGSKSKEKHINLRRPFTVGLGEEKPQKSLSVR